MKYYQINKWCWDNWISHVKRNNPDILPLTKINKKWIKYLNIGSITMKLLEENRSKTPSSFPGGTSGKESACQFRRPKSRRFDPWVRKIPRRRKMAAHSNTLAWRIPWIEEPGRLQSIGWQKARHDWSVLAHMHTKLLDIGLGNNFWIWYLTHKPK